jgi:hypothetical protein
MNEAQAVNELQEVISNRQQKIFKRLISDFYKEYKLITNDKIKLQSISKANVFNFYNQVIENYTLFADCNETVLSKIDFLKEINPEKVKVQWKTLHTLFIVCLNENTKITLNNIVVPLTKDDIINDFEKQRQQLKMCKAPPQVPSTPFGMDPQMIAQMMPMVTGILGNGSGGGGNPLMQGGMDTLIKETSDQLMKSLEGKEDQLKNINPMELFNGLMSGNNKIGDIDLSGIISNLQTSITTKIEKGELDPELIKQNASSMMDNLPEEFKSKLTELN